MFANKGSGAPTGGDDAIPPSDTQTP
jgi:hypothetical protein